MDNEAVQDMKQWLKTEPAERAIETTKHHILAGLATTDETFPIRQWDTLLPHLEQTLNMLQATRVNPKISAATWLYGQHNYAAQPLAPAGWKVMCFERTEQRNSWGFHGMEGFVFGTSPEHYHCYDVYIPSTGQTRTTDTIVFFPPKHHKLPAQLTPEQVLMQAAQQLGKAL